jgi:general secretion pathway protein I
MSRRRNGGQRGFTLIEVLVALSIIAYALIGLLGLQNRNLGMVARDQDLTRATLLARKFIAEMEVREKFPELGFSSGELEEGFYFEREVNETPLPDVREVRLRIIFDERQPDAVELLYYMRDRYVPEDL